MKMFIARVVVLIFLILAMKVFAGSVAGTDMDMETCEVCGVVIVFEDLQAFREGSVCND
jgi:hypothetical protein